MDVWIFQVCDAVSESDVWIKVLIDNESSYGQFKLIIWIIQIHLQSLFSLRQSFFDCASRMVRRPISLEALEEEFFIYCLNQRSSVSEPPFWTPESGPRVTIPDMRRAIDKAPLVFQQAWIRIIITLRVRAHHRRQFTTAGQVLQDCKAGKLEAIIDRGQRFTTFLW